MTVDSAEATLSDVNRPRSADSTADTVPASAKATRLTHIDGARGYLLSMMYLAHSAFALTAMSVPMSKGMLRLHHHKLLAVWDAEFFIPLSGFVCALAYLGVFRRDGMMATWQSILKRLKWVYLYQIVVAMSVVLLAAAVAPLPINGYVSGSPGALPEQLLRTLTFVNQPKNLDILLLYIVLMLGMPFGFALLVRRRYFTFAAILIGLWALPVLGIDQAASTYVTENIFAWEDYFRLSGAFNPLSWAVLFYAGFFLGYQFKSKGRDFAASYMKPDVRLFAIALAICAAMIVGRLSPLQAWLEPARVGMAWQSFAVVAAVAYSIYYLLNRTGLPPPLTWLRVVAASVLSFRPLVMLGQNSLFVYSLHVLIVAVLQLVVRQAGLGWNIPAMTLLFFIGYVVLFTTTLLKRRFLPSLP